MQFTSFLASLVLTTAVAAGPIPSEERGLSSTVGDITGNGNGNGNGSGSGDGNGNEAGNGNGNGNQAGNGNEAGNGNQAGNGNEANFLNNIGNPSFGETSQKIAEMAGITIDSPAAARRRRRRRVPDENRKRAPRACDRCKARKSKCIETDSGVCRRCQQTSLSCHFQRERSPGDVQSEVSRDGPNESTVTLDTNTSQASPEGRFSADGHPTERFMWPRFLSRLRETFSLDSEPEGEEDIVKSIQAQALRVPPMQPAELQRLRKAVDAFPPRPVANFLLSVCIDHGTDSFFYFNQPQFLAEINEFYTDTSSRLRTDSSFICLAHAAFALGSQWTTLERPEGREPSLLPEDSDPGRIFYNQARSLIPDVIDMPSLRAVQAPFVMGVYLLPASAIGSSYVYLGLALRKALALDLHLSSDDTNLSEEEQEIRRRIWWSIFSLERSSTVKLNRPRSINSAIITNTFPQPYEPLDRMQKFNNIEHQIADARLMMILDRVAEPSEWPTMMDGSTPFAAELKSWKRSLPDSLKWQNIHPRSSYYRATFHLYTNYYFTWIAMGKVSVVTVVRARLRYHFGREAEPPDIPLHVEALSKSCIKAAKKMLRLFEEIRSTGNLTRFSFTDFQACSIATIVVILAGILQRDGGYDAQVNFGLECLRRMAEGNVTAKMGVSFVEALQSIADEAVQKLQRAESPALATNMVTAMSTPAPTQQSDYNSWAAWLSRQNNNASAVTAGTGVSPDLLQSSPAGEITTHPMNNNTNWTLESQPAGFTTWDGASVLQQLSVPTIPAAGLAQPGSLEPQSLDSRFLSTMYNDDQAFLMGLTGFDVLGFSGLQDE